MAKQEVQQVAEGLTTLVVLEVTGDDWRGTLARSAPWRGQGAARARGRQSDS